MLNLFQQSFTKSFKKVVTLFSMFPNPRYSDWNSDRNSVFLWTKTWTLKMDFPDEHKMKTKTSGSTKEDRSCGGFFPLCNVMKKCCAKNTGNRLSVVWDRNQWPKSRSRHQRKRPRLMPCFCHLLPKTKTTRSMSKVHSLGKHQMSSIPLFLYKWGVVMLWGYVMLCN